MQAPAIVLVQSRGHELEMLQHHMRRQYGETLEVVALTSPEQAVELCEVKRQRGDAVALVLAAADVDGAPGSLVLDKARAVHPNAGRVLLTQDADVDAATRTVHAKGLHRYIVLPCEPPETKLYPILDELLEDWREREATPYLLVESVMDTGPHVARVGRDASLLEAAELVAQTRASDLMVVDEGDRFVGVLSEGDILRSALPDFDDIAEEGGTLRDAYQLFVRRCRHLAKTPVLPLVIRDPIVLRPDDHVAQAATILIDRQIRRLPVVADGQLVGTVSRANVCQVVVGRA